jgi:hypothetical protein
MKTARDRAIEEATFLSGTRALTRFMRGFAVIRDRVDRSDRNVR